MMTNRRVRAVLASRNCDDPKITYRELEYLSRFITPQGQILSRRRTGFCTQCQKQLKKSIKHARHMALMPFVG